MKSKLHEWAKSEYGRVTKISQYLGVSRVYASYLVNGKHQITAKNAIKLKELTGIPIEDLISGN